MTPKKLLPLVVIFVVLAVSYLASQWYQARQQRRDQEAKKLFSVKEADISEITLKKGQQEIRLVRREQGWELVTPLKAKADKAAVDSLLAALSFLEKDRDLGEHKDLAPFGLTTPALIVEFTAQEKKHQLAVGSKTPGDRGYYVLRDQQPHLFTISSYNKDSLDRSLSALRDKTLFQFAVDQVTGLKVTLGSLKAELRKSNGTWHWEGRHNFKVRRDRLESLLRQLTMTRIRDFVQEHPKHLRPYGLSPRPTAEVAVLLPQGQQRLLLGNKKDNTYYAHSPGGPVVLVEEDLLKKLKQSLASLEDRRFWTGDTTTVTRLSWGPPGKLWTALKDKDFFAITGPDKQSLRQPAVRLEVALLKFQELEQERPHTAAVTAPPQFILEFSDKEGRLGGRLEELGKTDKDKVILRWQTGSQTVTAAVSQAAYDQLRQDLDRLTQPPEKK